MSISNVSSGETVQPIPGRHHRTTVVAAWATTLLFSALMTASGAMLLAGRARLMETMGGLGYPLYFLKLLALAKLLGVLALVLPVPKVLREWAYAGFTFDLIAAIVSHVASGTPSHAGGAVAILVLLLSDLLKRSIWFAAPMIPTTRRRSPLVVQLPMAWLPAVARFIADEATVGERELPPDSSTPPIVIDGGNSGRQTRFSRGESGAE